MTYEGIYNHMYNKTMIFYLRIYILCPYLGDVERFAAWGILQNVLKSNSFDLF